MKLLSSDIKNKVLDSMITIIDRKREQILEANKKDLDAFNKDDQALYDRLVVDNHKINGMIKAIQEVRNQEDPVGKTISDLTLESGLKITNKTAPFGTILIIYESRPDVTIEAAVLAFKANNKILLKGGKEALHSNMVLEQCWHEALEENGLSKDWIKLLHLQREETREFLKNPTEKLDLIVPRGGERLIKFVKDHATCAVLVSGRGNNFLYVAKDADWNKTIKVIVNAKTNKISGCNALDKVLIDKHIPDYENKLSELQKVLSSLNVDIVADENIAKVIDSSSIVPSEETWYEEFLALKILLAEVDNEEEAIEMINKYSGGHSAAILTESNENAAKFMEQVDSAAVYHNASTRFTDGGQMGVGAELAISTDKLHHRGPLGLKQLVTNKYYVFGDGHIRE
ncbi:glutamate-5-semialdehyde dehydrogenase [Mangrovimonas sp. DI 80]|uniref:glutamate-5-semialdehyde dehydrogenase n=1 Tax=Mangrovimonas sp. DI 80 TaxID=1779330 RepID=UPI0009786A0E|nr:glutamate-5-semialdehyde dehydrogenase [Mangrovimonas sp. DI 80]OMP31763.1 glutamate-5-semialdehyde dehydrogenase [Mangrovimonas sp. DI 80]